MRREKKRSPKERYKRYSEWIGNDAKKGELKKWLEKAGIPLELRTIKFLEEQGYRCSTYHCQDPDTGKYRELDINASKTNIRSFKVGKCEIVFNALILAECKYSHNLDLLAFESADSYFPAFPVIFPRERILGAFYHNFEFPVIIKKIAETDLYNLASRENFQDKKTHEACEKLTFCFSRMYERIKKRSRVFFDKYRLSFGKTWLNYMSKGRPIKDKRALQRKIREFLKENFKAEEVLTLIRYFPIYIGFPLMIIPKDRGLIRIKCDMTTGQITDFEDSGYGIYPYVSENADKYDNILHGFFAFPIIICNLAYLDDCLGALNKGIEKIASYVEILLHNDPYAIAEQVLEEIYTEHMYLRK